MGSIYGAVKKAGGAFLFPVAAWAERDEVAQVERRSAFGDGLDGLRGNRHHWDEGAGIPTLPQGESIGQPPACRLPSAAPAPSFLGRDGGGGAPDVASLGRYLLCSTCAASRLRVRRSVA